MMEQLKGMDKNGKFADLFSKMNHAKNMKKEL